MNKYKFRAECIADIIKFMEVIRALDFEVGFCIHAHSDTRDCICTINTNLTLEIVSNILHLITDAHVMRETLANEDEYTGIRK